MYPEVRGEFGMECRGNMEALFDQYRIAIHRGQHGDARTSTPNDGSPDEHHLERLSG